jgi:hypothetical protein
LGLFQEKFLTMPSVNEAEFWQRVGRILAEARGERTHSAVKTATGIDAKTLQSIEAGRPGVVEKFSRYSRYLGLDPIDVMASALSEGTVSPEAAEWRRLFAELRPDGREALLGVARTMPRAEAAKPSVTPGQPPSAPQRGRRTG